MRDCKFCQRFWAFVFAYAFPLTTLAVAAFCLGLYAVIML